MLWVAVHLPSLSLEAWAGGLPAAVREGPIALVDRLVSGRRLAHTVVASNAAAQALGVHAGQRRATALALVPQIVLGRADPARDAEALGAVAHAALAYTPSVALEPTAAAQGEPSAASHTVLLEVQASLRCFGGRAQLLQRLAAALAPLGHATRCACAPTPQAAALLARSALARPLGEAWACAIPVVDQATLVAALDELPVRLLASGAVQAAALADIGVRTIADLRRLPRAGLAQRYGRALHDELDRALGRKPDPRAWVAAAPTFCSRVELHARVDTTELLLQGATVLVARLIAWATAHQALVGRCVLRLHHERHRRHADTPPITDLELALAEPSCDRSHLLLLLRERLGRLVLPAPTLELDLLCDRLVLSAPPNLELFATRASERLGMLQLIERLQARLGAEQVQRLTAVHDHRPECASATTAAVAAVTRPTPRPPSAAVAGTAPQPTPSPWAAQRPVWLLPHPEPLAERRSRPVLDGRPLQLVCGPERIESGWWDGALAERDYFIAEAAGGALVWIYRTRLPLSAEVDGGWFLHGRFA